MDHQTRHFAAADARQAILYECRQSPGGALGLRSLESIHKHEGATREHFAREDGGEEEERRFARELTAWICRLTGQYGPPTVYAPARLLTVLRETAGPRVRLEEGELTQLPIARLAWHPLIQSELSQPAR